MTLGYPSRSNIIIRVLRKIIGQQGRQMWGERVKKTLLAVKMEKGPKDQAMQQPL